MKTETTTKGGQTVAVTPRGMQILRELRERYLGPGRTTHRLSRTAGLLTIPCRTRKRANEISGLLGELGMLMGPDVETAAGRVRRGAPKHSIVLAATPAIEGFLLGRIGLGEFRGRA